MALITGLVGLGGATLGGVLAWKRESKQARTAFIFDMHREFNTGDVSKARGLAHEVLIANPDVPLTELLAKVGPEKSHDVWVLLNFFLRLRLAVQHGRIDGKLVFPLFGETVIWWARVHFADRMEHGIWDSYDAVFEMESWFEKRYGRNANFAKWAQRAATDRERFYS